MTKSHLDGGTTEHAELSEIETCSFLFKVLLLGARTLLGAPGLTTRSKKLLGTMGIAARSKECSENLSCWLALEFLVFWVVERTHAY